MGQLIRYSPAKRLEIIRLVENSSLSTKATLADLSLDLLWNLI